MTKLSLSSFAPVPRAKSKAARLAEVLPEIEAALKAGHTHRAIFEDVKRTVGLDLTFGYYENTIHRIRQRTGSYTKENAVPPKAPVMVIQKPIFIPSSSGVSAIGAPTSELQKAMSGPVDDFFS